MKTHIVTHLAKLSFILLAFGGAAQCLAGQYQFVKEIPVGGEGGWDYLSIDPAAHRLYVTHATKIVVIDLTKDAVAGEIADTQGVHGFAIAADLGRGFSSNGKESTASIVDLKTLQTISKVKTGENPDAILYNPAQQEVYTFNGRGKSATIFEAKTGNVVATVPLPGKPEFAAFDQETGRVYCNIEDKNEVVTIDAKTHQVADTWPLAPGEEPSGMAIDTEHHRLFIGCSNKLMIMMDDKTGKVLNTAPIGGGVDANAFDAQRQFAFASCGEGVVTIAKEDTPEKMTVVQTLSTERGSRTMALDSVTHNLYLAAAKFEPLPTPSPGAPRQRPNMVPGSFKILVYAEGK
jgi:hypothetical protein